MNTAPAASATPIRNETATASTAQSGQPDAPASAFDILFGSLFGAPLLLPGMPAAKAPFADGAGDELPAPTPQDLGNWMQQLPLPPLEAQALPTANLAGGSGLPSTTLAGDAQAQALGKGMSEAAMLAAQADGAAELPPLLRAAPATSDPALQAVQLTPAPLAEVVTKALLRRTEVVQPSAPNSPASAAAEAAQAAAPDSPLEVALPPGSAPKIEQAFTEGMAMRLQWMAQQQVGRAEIQLHPADLGSIDVQIEFDGKTVRADFLSGSSEVRQLLETHLPRLRELLEAQGLQLQQANVGGGSGHGAEPGAEQPASRAMGSEIAAIADEAETPAAPRNPRHEGGLSEYA